MNDDLDREHDFTYVRKTTLNRIIGNGEIASEAFDAWYKQRNAPSFFPGVLLALQELRDDGFKIGTLTDGMLIRLR